MELLEESGIGGLIKFDGKENLFGYGGDRINKYNIFASLSGKEKVNEDLDQYVTNKAIDGLFTLMSIEENKIRKDPVARVSDILKKVFGSLDNKS